MLVALDTLGAFTAQVVQANDPSALGVCVCAAVTGMCALADALLTSNLRFITTRVLLAISFATVSGWIQVELGVYLMFTSTVALAGIASRLDIAIGDDAPDP